MPGEDKRSPHCCWRVFCPCYYLFCCCCCCEQGMKITKMRFVGRFQKWIHVVSSTYLLQFYTVFFNRGKMICSLARSTIMIQSGAFSSYTLTKVAQSKNLKTAGSILISAQRSEMISSFTFHSSVVFISTETSMIPTTSST